MEHYEIKWKKSAVKELQALPNDIANKVLAIVDSLKDHMIQANSIKLAGTINSYRIRISNYRLIYSIFKNELIVQIIKIGHRKEVYKKK